jgi:hypothetical protein
MIFRFSINLPDDVKNDFRKICYYSVGEIVVAPIGLNANDPSLRPMCDAYTI